MSTTEHLQDEQPNGSPTSQTPPPRRLLRWVVGIMLVPALTAAATAAAWYLQTPLYSATSILQVRQDFPRLVEAPATNSAESFQAYAVYKRSQTVWLKSDFVVGAALRDLDIGQCPALRSRKDPAKWLVENLQVTFPNDAELMLVSLSADDPEGLHVVVNSIVDAYLREIVYVEKERFIRRNTRLELATKTSETNYRSKLNELRAIQEIQQGGSPDPEIKKLLQQTAVHKFDAILQHHTRVELDLRHAKLALEAAEKRQQLPPQVSSRQLRAALQSDPFAVQTASELQKLAELLPAGKAVEQEGANREKVELARLLAEREQKYLAREAALRQELIQDQTEELAAEIASLQKKIELLSREESQLAAQVAETERQIQRLGRVSLDVELARQEAQTLEQITQQLRHQFLQQQIDITGSDDAARVVRSARAEPAQIVEVKQVRPLTVGIGIGSFCLSLLGVVWFNSRRGA
jgi:uncharacterized protein involved in exopolysaccharide biosynthesis